MAGWLAWLAAGWLAGGVLSVPELFSIGIIWYRSFSVSELFGIVFSVSEISRYRIYRYQNYSVVQYRSFSVSDGFCIGFSMREGWSKATQFCQFRFSLVVVEICESDVLFN